MGFKKQGFKEFTILTALGFAAILQGCYSPSSKKSNQTTQASKTPTTSSINSLMNEIGLSNSYSSTHISKKAEENPEASAPQSEEGVVLTRCQLKPERFKSYFPPGSAKNYKIIGSSVNEMFHHNGVLQFLNSSGIHFIHFEDKISYENVSGISYAFVGEVTRIFNTRGIHSIVADKVGDIGGDITPSANAPSTVGNNYLDTTFDYNPDDIDPGRRYNPQDLDLQNGTQHSGNVSSHVTGAMKTNGVFCIEANQIADLNGFSGILTLIGKYPSGNKINGISNFKGILHVTNMDIGSLSNFKGILKMKGGQVENIDNSSVDGIVHIR